MGAELGTPEASLPPAPGSAPRRRFFSSVAFRRVLFALLAVAICEAVGAVGFHALEGFGWVDSVYEESMLATGQGPSLTLGHDSSKLFASVMGFVSVGTTFSTITLAIAPVLARLWHEARWSVEEDARRLGREISHTMEVVREELHPSGKVPRPMDTPPPRRPGES